MATIQFPNRESAEQYYRAVRASYAENVVRIRLPKTGNHVFQIIRPIESDLQSLADVFRKPILERFSGE